jgi:hypothetical protein
VRWRRWEEAEELEERERNREWYGVKEEVLRVVRPGRVVVERKTVAKKERRRRRRRGFAVETEVAVVGLGFCFIFAIEDQ